MHDTPTDGVPPGRLRRLWPTPDPLHRYPRVTSARVLAAAFDVLVGLRLLWPDDSLGSTPAYELANTHFLGDLGLGIALLGIGLVMGASLYTEKLDKIAAALTLLGLATWAVFALDLLLDNGSQIGTFAYGVLAGGTHAYALAHLLSWRDQRQRDERRGPERDAT